MAVRKGHVEYPELAQSIPLGQKAKEGDLKIILQRCLDNQGSI